MTQAATAFDEALRTAPARPGCYLFRDSQGAVLYVGKALDIRRRVQVYRRAGADGRARLSDLLDHAAAAEFFVTSNEQEAVLLEDRLVKRHQPPLNVLLKDDKSFLLVHLDTTHAFPRIGLARRRSSRGEYFGPYANAGAARRAKRLLMKAFGLRDCSDHTLANRSRPCLKHPIGLCTAPCVGAVTEPEYAGLVGEAREVLAGKVREHLESSRDQMETASERMEYEAALRARDRMYALEALASPQRVRLTADRDFDVVGLDERGQFSVLQYRTGDWIGTRRGAVPLVSDAPEMLAELVPALYRNESEVPPEVLLSALPEEAAAIEAWLSDRVGHRVRLRAPARGEKRALVRMAESNARAQKGATARAPWPVVAARLAELTRYHPPAVVDCIDVSHFQGGERVASKVRFVEGRADRSQYRRYRVGDGHGNDDYAAMREVVGRVLRRDSDGLADLIVLDGGKLQLDAGLKAVAAEGHEAPLAALAKARRGKGPVAAEERLFVPGREQPVILERGSPERLFLERIRDEAHRFAVHYHRRSRENLRLVLEQVPGIGPKKRSALLDAFGGDLAKIRDAAPDELLAVPGVTADLIEALQQHLRDRLP